MVRPTKPTIQKKLNGTLEKSRVLENEYTPPAIERVSDLSPPDFLTDSQKLIFQDVADRHIKNQLLTKVDVDFLTGFAIEYDRYINAIIQLNNKPLTDDGKVNPLVRVAESALKSWVKIGIEFGMSPAARTKVASAPKEQRGIKSMLNSAFSE